jgi:hypothetical protein
MRKLSLSILVFLVVLLPICSMGQQIFRETDYTPYNRERITVANVAIALNPLVYGFDANGNVRVPKKAFIRSLSSSGEVVFCIDGSAPTASTVGIPLEQLEWVVLANTQQIYRFQAIRTGSSSGYLEVAYFD